MSQPRGSVEEIEVCNKSSGWTTSEENFDVNLASGGPYRIVGYRYRATGTIGITSLTFVFYRLVGTDEFLVVDSGNAEFITEITSLSAAATSRREVYLKSADANRFHVSGTYRLGVTWAGTVLGSEVVQLYLLVERI